LEIVFLGVKNEKKVIFGATEQKKNGFLLSNPKNDIFAKIANNFRQRVISPTIVYLPYPT